MEERELHDLPNCVTTFIAQVIRKMRYGRKVRREVQRELTDHFLDALGNVQDVQERDRIAAEHVAGFGDPAILGRLLRRAKKRCRPLAVKVVLRTMQAAGILLLCIIGRVVHLSTGTPVIRVDYVKWMNEQVRNGRDENLNARPYYEKAVQLSKPIPEALKQKMYDLSKELPASEVWDDVEAFLAENVDAIDALRQGAAKPFYWNTYDVKWNAYAASPSPGPDLAGRITSEVLPTLSSYKKLANDLAFIHIPWSLHIGNIEQAVNDNLVLHRFAQHLTGPGLLTEQLTGTALEGLAHATTYEIVGKHTVSAELLERYQRQLQESYADKVVMDFELEKGIWYDFIQRTFTDDGNGGGRPMKTGLTLAAGDLRGYLRGFVAGYPDRREVTAGMEAYYAQAEQLATRTPWQLKQTGQEDARWEAAAGRNFMLNLTNPAYQKIVDIGWRVRTGRAALATVLAIKRYEQDKGTLPASLNALVENGYLDKLPPDPFGQGALRYKAADTDFLLYSRGANMADDNGRPGMKDGQPYNWSEDGDWVFWPPLE